MHEKQVGPGYSERYKRLLTSKCEIDNLRSNSRSIKLKVHVISPGGVATTMLLKHITSYIEANLHNDGDGLKHLPRFRDVPVGSEKIVYLAGNPFTIIRSLERRQYHSVHILKLGLGPRFAATEFWRPVLFGLIIRQYCSFKIASILKPYKVMMISYSELWNRLEDIRLFLHLEDPDFTHSFPSKKDRLS